MGENQPERHCNDTKERLREDFTHDVDDHKQAVLKDTNSQQTEAFDAAGYGDDITPVAMTAQENHTSAAQRVLITPELLEAILVESDMKTILMSQRVARSWRDLIQRSLCLQRALFLTPVCAMEKVTNLEGLLGAWDGTPRGINVFGLSEPVDMIPFVCSSDRKYTDNYVSRCSLTVNPLLGHILDCLQNEGPIRAFYHQNVQMYRNGPFSQDQNHPQASWRKMLLTQPPCLSSNLKVVSTCSILRSDYTKTKDLSYPHPRALTVSEFKDALLLSTHQLADIKDEYTKSYSAASASPTDCTMSMVSTVCTWLIENREECSGDGERASKV